MQISWNINWKVIVLILPRADKCLKEGNFFSYTDNEGPDVAERYVFTLSLTSAIDGGKCLTQSLCLLTPRKKTWYSLYGRRLGLGACQDDCSHLTSTGFQTPKFPARSEWRLVCSKPTLHADVTYIAIQWGGRTGNYGDISGLS